MNKFLLAVTAALALLLMYTLATEETRLQKRVIGATGMCHDGAITSSPRGKQGVCSSHGGVKKWFD